MAKAKKNMTGKTEKELFALVAEKQAALHTFRFGIAGSKVKNVKEGRNLRKEIARAKTELSAQRIAVSNKK